jgi:hypothetical protein
VRAGDFPQISDTAFLSPLFLRLGPLINRGIRTKKLLKKETLALLKSCTKIVRKSSGKHADFLRKHQQ